MNTDRQMEHLLKMIVSMSAIELREYYAGLVSNENGSEFVARLLAAVEAIADFKFPGSWRFAGMAVDHIDGNPRNNSPRNLRLVSTSENRGR